MTKPEITIPLSALWKTPLGWILMLGLASFLGLGGAGMIAGNSGEKAVDLKVGEHAIRIEHMEDDIREIKELCKDINRKLDRMRSNK